MDFLDAKKQRAATIRLIIGYVLIVIALVLATIILLYEAYGFSFKNGQVIQSGLVFVSSQPSPATIYVSGQTHTETTDARLLLPAGQYTFKLQRNGYRTWQRAITVEGGVVERFDYPFLFPTTPVTKVNTTYATSPSLTTQSLDRHWLLIQSDPTDYGTFDLLDLTHPTQTPVTVVVPADVFNLTIGTSSWQVVQWANDDQHVLLKHTTTNGSTQASEYIMVDTQTPQDSFNLTQLLGENPTTIELNSNLYNSYFLYSQPADTLMTATLSDPTPQPLLTDVSGFDAHGASTILFATNQGALPGKAFIKLLYGGQTYIIREVTASPTYILDITQYNGAWYAVAGSPVDNSTYVYRNPAQALQSTPDQLPAPVDALNMPDPNFVDFSADASLVTVENGSRVAVYDTETNRAYAYTLALPLDVPQTHVNWMDSDRLAYVSGGKVVVLDFDNTNRQVLNAADPAYNLFFDTNYKYLYTFDQTTSKDNTSGSASELSLNSTALLTPQDE